MIFGNMKLKKESKYEKEILNEKKIEKKVDNIQGMSVKEMKKELIRNRIKVGSEFVKKEKKKEKVEFEVEEIEKDCYESMLRWMVNRIKRQIDSKKRKGEYFIGIMDMDGFEIFELN